MKPNILFIFSDQHRFCDLGYAGNAQLNTPNLDSLAAEGAVFNRAYSNCPVCVPARGSLFTALHPLRHGAAGNDIPIREGLHSVADDLNAAGYDTAYIGKWHLGGVPRDQFITQERRLGFNYWRASNCNHDYMNYYYDDNENVRHHVEGYEPEIQTGLALEYLESQKGGDKPWAMYLCYSTPHPPYLRMPEDKIEHAKKREVALRPNVERFNEYDFTPPEGHHAYGYTPRWKMGYESIDELRLNIAGYYEHIESLDVQIGRIFDWLRANGQYDNTLIVYSSDHGDMLGSHGMADKQIFYEESAHIPLIMKWKGNIPAGSRDQLIGIEDMSPTILGLIGEKMPGDIDGHDLSRCARDPDAKGLDYLYFHNIVPAHNAWHRANGTWRAVTDGRFVYAAYENGAPMALYDLDTDPFEMHDLKDECAAQRARLADVLKSFVEKHDGFMPWQRLLVINGLADLWDLSEKTFGYPLIEERYRR